MFVSVSDPLLSEPELSASNLLKVTVETAYSLPETWTLLSGPAPSLCTYTAALEVPLAAEASVTLYFLSVFFNFTEYNVPCFSCCVMVLSDNLCCLIQDQLQIFLRSLLQGERSLTLFLWLSERSDAGVLWRAAEGRRTEGRQWPTEEEAPSSPAAPGKPVLAWSLFPGRAHWAGERRANWFRGTCISRFCSIAGYRHKLLVCGIEWEWGMLYISLSFDRCGHASR